MSMRLLGRAGAGAALAAFLVAAGPASPARAEPGVTIDSPATGKVFDTDTVTVTGSADADNHLLFNMKEVTLSIGSQATTVTCSDTPCPFSWNPSLPLNGSYDLKVTAVQKTVLLGSTGSSTTANRSFGVAAPPKVPSLDPPQVNGDRTVSLSWSRNTEPDLLYYGVFRTDPGTTKSTQVGQNVKQPTSGSKVTFTDTTTTFAGGDYTYRIVAVRKGVGSAEVSSTSKQASSTVPPPPTTTTATPPPGSPQGGPATTAKPGPPGGVDLNSFLASRAAPKVLTPATIPEAPDTGFNESLPFGARPPGDDVEPGEEQASPPGRRVTSVVEQLRGSRPLVPVAAGLILLLLAMHLRLLNRRVKAGADLPVDLSVASTTGGTALPGMSVLDDDSDCHDNSDRHDDAQDASDHDDNTDGHDVVDDDGDDDPSEAEPLADPAGLYDQHHDADDPPVEVVKPADLPDDRWAPVVSEDDGEEFADDEGVPVVVTAGGRRDWEWDQVEVREVVSPPHR